MLNLKWDTHVILSKAQGISQKRKPKECKSQRTESRATCPCHIGIEWQWSTHSRYSYVHRDPTESLKCSVIESVSWGPSLPILGFEESYTRRNFCQWCSHWYTHVQVDSFRPMPTQPSQTQKTTKQNQHQNRKSWMWRENLEEGGLVEAGEG